MGSTKYTFWKLLNEYTIEIPIIQRDYAQGRDSQKVSEIRDNFLESLHKAIKSNKHLDFDFVYGSLKGKNGNTKFIPLDGQQRLTTLFLLHWYLAVHDFKILNDEIKTVLSRFSYEVRTSSRDFCHELINEGIDVSELEQKKVSEIIKNSRWFFLSWEKDPTVKSMLTMLDSIQEKFSDCDGFFESLRDEVNAPVTFQFIKLENFGLTDGLYIKMNARGKPLSDFENFKAKFEQFLEARDKAFRTNTRSKFVKKVDGEWTDLFWKHKEDFVIDRPFMRYLNFITEMLFYLRRYDDLDLKYVGINPQIGFEVIERVYSDEKNIEYLFESLDFFHDVNDTELYFTSVFSQKDYTVDKVALFQDQVDLFVKCVKDRLFGLPEKVILFTIVDYNLKLRAKANVSDLTELVRVVRNLLSRVRQQNQTVYNSNLRVDTLEVIIAEISTKLIVDKNVYEQLLTPDLFVEGFSKESLGFEIEKAELIIANLGIKSQLFQLEDNPLLQGSIHNFDLKTNHSSLSKLNQAFRDIWSVQDDSLIIRGMLSVADYSITTGGSALGQKWYFGSSSNWYTIVTHPSSWIKKILPLFLQSYLQLTTGNIEDRIKSLISQLIKNCTTKDWRYYFLKYPEMVNGKNSVYTWKADSSNFELRNIQGNYLTSYHINPYVRTVANLVGKKDVCSVNDCYGIYSEEKPLVLKNGVELFCLEQGWFVSIPAGLIIDNQLFSDFDLKNINGGTQFLLSEDHRDRVQVALEFCNEIAD